MRKYKLFISYSSEDKETKENIIQYLKPLVKSNKIEIWHDGELRAGDLFDNVIKNKLLESDIVVFLLSQSFLNSDYCQNVEAELTFNKFDDNDDDALRIIPIVVKNCHWKLSEFQRFNMPFKANPISEMDDNVYFKISEEIMSVIDLLDSSRSYKLVKFEEKKTPFDDLTPDYKKYIIELGFNIEKNGAENILLEDLFVYPDLKRINNEIENIDSFVDSFKLINNIDFNDSKYLFIGDEQSGKSTFAKVIYKKALLEGFRPITIKGDSIKSANELDKYVEKAILEQYKASDFFQSSKILLLIDGLTDSPLNTKFKKNFLKNVFLKYENVIIFSDSIVRLEDQIMNELSEFLTYEFQSMGAKKKDQLIDKWNLIGIDETCDDCDIQSRHDYLVRSVDSIMMRNIVPKKPIFVLMVLQILETSTPNDYSLTSYGHCYHSLILSAFSRANIRQDLYADYFNYLSELAYFFYKKNTERLNKDDLIEFKSYYSENYIVSSHDEIFDKLIKSKIIVSNFKEEYYFQYKYLLYFFVAKKITDAEQEELINQVDILCDKLHSEKHANILIFITHHTKSKDVITSIVSRVSKIFETYKPAKLDINEMKFLNKFANKISEYTAKVVIDNNKDIDEEREKKLEKEDKQEKEISLLANNEEDEDISFDEMNQDLLDVNRSYRALEILGQIIRNRKGSLHKKQLDQLGLEAYGVGLRFLKYYLNITQNLENEIIDEIHRLIETKRNWSKERIEKEAKFFYWTFSYMMSLNVVKKIGFCVGHKDLVSFYETISQKMNSEVADLIEIQIEIEFGKIIPKEKIEKLWKKMENNLITRRLLQEILVRHLHLNYVNHKDKQWISHTLSIPIKDQQRFQQDAINTRHQLNNISI